MKLRQGFTLIELLIVVTIIAILAGAAIPYVQDYVDESRRARVKNDLDEIRNALALYEVRRGIDYDQNSIASLIGPFLSKALNDPWGAPYVVCPASSTAYSVGPDGKDETGDEIGVDFRPRMAITRFYWLDKNKDGLVTPGTDKVEAFLTRLASGTPGSTLNINDVLITSWATTDFDVAAVIATTGRSIILNFATAFVPGSDTVTIPTGTGIEDKSNLAAKEVKGDSMKVLAQ